MNDTLYQAPTLPLELFQSIFEELHLQSDLVTLSSASLTCRALRYEAQTWLFRCPMGLGPATVSQLGVAIGNCGATYYKRVKDPSIHVAFLTTIASSTGMPPPIKGLWGRRASLHANPHLAKYVNTYAIDSILHYKENPLWSLLLTTLPMMANLKCLTFRAFGGHPCAKELLANCTFQLQYLDWGSHSDEAAMSAFLIGQRELRHLSLDCDQLLNLSPRQSQINSNHLPNLSSIEGGRALIESLLPTRNITSVSWVPQLEEDPSEPVGNLHEEFGQIKRLSFGGYFYRPHFQLVAPYLKSVELLQLMGLHNTDELNSLSSLPALRELVISFTWASLRPPVPTEPTKRAEIIGNLFKECRKLERVDAVYEWRSLNEIWYHSWTKPVDTSGELVMRVLKMEEVKRGRF